MPQPLWYGGFVYDRELQSYWLATREYSPGLGRFLQPDPSEQEGARGYVYAGDDPFDATDPSGLWPCILGHGDCGGGGGSVETAAAGVGLVVLGAVTDVVSPFALLAGPEAAPVTAGGEEAGTSLIEAGVGLLGGGGVRAGLGATATLAAAHATGDAVRAIQSHHDADSSISDQPTGSSSSPESAASPPSERPGLYSGIPGRRLKIEPGRDYSDSQKTKIYAQNRQANGGQLQSDDPSDPYQDLVPPTKSVEGVTPDPNEAQVDHFYPADLGGSNSFANARVVSRYFNRLKSNKPPY